jgi:hypothetical protein
MRRLNVFVGAVAVLVVSATARYTWSTGLPTPCTPCIPITSESSELCVPLKGTPNMSPCVPGGTWVSGYMKIKSSFSVSTCGTRVKQETSSCGKICVPGLGEFTSSERHLHETSVGTGGTEYTIIDRYYHRKVGCSKVYRLDCKIRVKISSCGVVAHCESIHIDCLEEDIPCCGSVL